jgi:hypothetical protein
MIIITPAKVTPPTAHPEGSVLSSYWVTVYSFQVDGERVRRYERFSHRTSSGLDEAVRP